MEIVRSMRASVSAPDLFPHVATLDAYPPWMPLIYEVAPLVSDGGNPAWSVELRARVGPFARSKRLRMERVELETNRLAVFERREHDEREHSQWRLCAELRSVDDDQVELTMTMGYDGSLWAGPILERVLDEQVRQGSSRLSAIVAAGSPR